MLQIPRLQGLKRQDALRSPNGEVDDYYPMLDLSEVET